MPSPPYALPMETRLFFNSRADGDPVDIEHDVGPSWSPLSVTSSAMAKSFFSGVPIDEMDGICDFASLDLHRHAVAQQAGKQRGCSHRSLDLTDPAFIVSRVLELTHTSHSMMPFARDLGYEGQPWPGTKSPRDSFAPSSTPDMPAPMASRATNCATSSIPPT
jgi:hypothetical protein